MRNSTKSRRICAATHTRRDLLGREVMDCHVCKLVMPVHTSGWEADHIRRFAEGGADTADNLWPVCPRCHHDKSLRDTSEIAKGKRMAERSRGVRRSQRPMPGSRRSGWKHTMSGEWVKRRGTSVADALADPELDDTALSIDGGRTYHDLGSKRRAKTKTEVN